MLRRVSLLLVLLFVVTACVRTTGETTTTAGVTSTEGSTTTGAGPSDDNGTTTTTRATPTPTPPDLSALDLPPQVQAQLEGLIIEAEEIRGLPFLTPPNITVVSDAELEARVREAIVEEAEDFPADEALYKLLGLLDQGADLEDLLLDLYGEQVAGFYDGDTGEIVVPAREDGFSILQQGTMIHELVHAITDQHFAFDPIFQEMLDEERLDEATGYQALIEGDATLAEVLWVQGLSRRDLGEFIAESLEIDSSTLEAAPQFIQDSLLFPYDSGLGFVQRLYTNGGWDAVNDVYSTYPGLPGSSEQVITPDDYQRDLPVRVDIPDVDIAGYSLERTSVWGEGGFRIMLDQVVGETTGARAADGWGGDAYHQWFDGENAAFLIVYEGDTERDLEELRQALLDFALASVPEEDFVWVDEENGLLYFIAADEVEVGELIRSSVGLG